MGVWDFWSASLRGLGGFGGFGRVWEGFWEGFWGVGGLGLHCSTLYSGQASSLSERTFGASEGWGDEEQLILFASAGFWVFSGVLAFRFDLKPQTLNPPKPCKGSPWT